MRRSIERKKRATAVAASRHHHVATRRRTAGIVILAVIVIAGGIFGGLHLFANAQTKVNRSATHTDSKQTKSRVANVIETVQKAEQAAQDQLAQAAKAVTQTTKQEPSLAKTNTTTGSVACDVTNPASITVVVNKKHCFSPPSWAPPDLVNVDGFLMRSVAANAMQQMRQAASAAGVGFDLSSGYRSYSDQVATYNYWVQVNGSAAAADTVSARPGYSEHQTGLAADLKTDGCVLECFANTAQYTWLKANAASFGFIERYPPGLTAITGYSPEAWHWRYVGVPTATAMKNSGVQTLEAYFNISGGDYN